MRPGRPAVLALAALSLAGCRTHDPAKELSLGGIETYWVVDSPREGQNFIAPVVRFRLKNISTQTIGSVQARARFPAPGQEESWGSIQEQVSTWTRPLEPGKEAVVTVRSAGRYQSSAAPEDMLRSSGFRDPSVEIFVRIGSSYWARLGAGKVERRIGAPEAMKLGTP